MTPDYFDIHSHLNFSQFNDDRDEVIKELYESKTWTISVGTDLETSKEVVGLAQKNKHIFACIGAHPEDYTGSGWDKVEFSELVKNKKVVAIGECGLDYFRGKETDVPRQKKLFEKQIEFAVEQNKPLMIHCRDAYNDVYDILTSYSKKYGEILRGNMHFFAGSIEQARKFLDINFTLSFTGVITFTKDYDDVIRFAPLDRIMSETDAPFVAPVPYRGKRASPVHVAEVVRQIAIIREEEFGEVRKAMVANALRQFCLTN